MVSPAKDFRLSLGRPGFNSPWGNGLLLFFSVWIIFVKFCLGSHFQSIPFLFLFSCGAFLRDFFLFCGYMKVPSHSRNRYSILLQPCSSPLVRINHRNLFKPKGYHMYRPVMLKWFIPAINHVSTEHISLFTLFLEKKKRGLPLEAAKTTYMYLHSFHVR